MKRDDYPGMVGREFAENFISAASLELTSAEEESKILRRVLGEPPIRVRWVFSDKEADG